MGTELSIREEQVPVGLSLIDGPDPATAVAYARQVSGVIASVLEEGSGFVTIQNKRHITIEGWQTLAAMTGHTVEVEWSRIVPGLADPKGIEAWEARAVVRDQTGRVVAAGESMADPNEPGAGSKWARGGNFSVRSMAQTRAMSRALSSRMRYIVQLAGFSGTPAEEIGEEREEQRRPTAPAWQERQVEVERRAAALGIVDPGEFFGSLGVDHPRKLANAATWRKVDAELTKREQAQVADDEPIEGEVVEHPESTEPTLPGTEAPSSHPMDPEDRP